MYEFLKYDPQNLVSPNINLNKLKNVLQGNLKTSRVRESIF